MKPLSGSAYRWITHASMHESYVLENGGGGLAGIVSWSGDRVRDIQSR
jgi:hypothetical protein